tara:strand:+ start:316 stop:1365 length:1050 start_codon:yes stop_codon:yes gene_type:complete
MSEEQVEAKENVAEELTEWSEVDLSPTNEQEKIEFEVEGAEPEVESKPEVEEASSEPAAAEAASAEASKDLPELEGIETKGAEKRIRQLVKQKKEREARIAQLEAERQQLLETVTERDKNAVDMHKVSYDQSAKQLQQQAELAKQSYLTAYDSGDKENMLKAQELLNQTQVELNNIEQNKNQLSQYEKTLEAREAQRQQQLQAQQQQQQADTSDYDPMAVEWSQKPENSWFGSDNIMTVAALTIDAQLKEEGYNPASPDFYQEVDSRMRQEFPHKFNQQVVAQEVPAQRATQQVVAGQSRSPTNSSSKKVKLTQEDVRMAQKWNIPLEKYAAEKARADRAAGEYVPISG